MEGSLKYLFDRTAGSYDRARRKLVPCFDEFYRSAVELLPFGRDDEFQVLDLGAGTGLLSAFVAFSYPRARITMVDISQEMLAQARDRFAVGGSRFVFEVADYEKGRITGHYDAVMSALSLHHLGDTTKRTIFEQAHAALSPGGVFINADQVRGETGEIDRRSHDRWISRVRELGASEHDLMTALEQMKFDHTATAAEQLDWLRETGFKQVGLAYRNLIFAVYFGTR